MPNPTPNLPKFHLKPTLTGEKVILRPFSEGDGQRMLEILAEPEVRRLTGSVTSEAEAQAPDSEEEKERIRQWYRTRSDQTDRLDLAICDRASGELVGEAVFNEYDPSTGNVNFRILIGAAGQGKGIGSEAVGLFLRYGFEELKLHKVELSVFSFNPRAERVYRKNGFRLEGIRREDLCYEGEYVDSLLFGILRSEYEGEPSR
ncbi:GNAT family N-acetyltransferase [Gorillibacterium sp. sgz500922]|uniref:GNAT family N-acetyltransferase n=1 Tax=Gorillibacterium sp. sgz500922 TaxID=3446694 RepID=UPI003F66E76E